MLVSCYGDGIHDDASLLSKHLIVIPNTYLTHRLRKMKRVCCTDPGTLIVGLLSASFEVLNLNRSKKQRLVYEDQAHYCTLQKYPYSPQTPNTHEERPLENSFISIITFLRLMAQARH